MMMSWRLVAPLLGLVLAIGLSVAPGGGALALDKGALKTLWSDLNDNDKQTIKVASQKFGNTLTTPKDSPNGRFWQALQGEGYLESVDVTEVYGEAAAPALRAAGFQIFRVTFEGARVLPELLEEFAKP